MSDPDLDPAVGALFSKARAASAPPTGAQERVLAGVLSKAALPLATPTKAAGAGVKIAAAIAGAVVVAAVVAYLAWPARKSAPAPRTPPSSSETVSSSESTGSTTSAPPDPVELPPVIASAPSATTKAATAKASGEADSLDQDFALLSEARTALSGGKPQQALGLLDTHAARFPKSTLAPERTAMRIQALCGVGRLEEARTLLSKMRASAPSSPHYTAIRRACPTLVEKVP